MMVGIVQNDSRSTLNAADITGGEPVRMCEWSLEFAAHALSVGRIVEAGLWLGQAVSWLQRDEKPVPINRTVGQQAILDNALCKYDAKQLKAGMKLRQLIDYEKAAASHRLDAKIPPRGSQEA